RDLIDAYRQAGEGLAAAHRAGLNHRDFKPDNAIRGDDGRVRVLDFGLAHSDGEAPEPGRLAGTLRYMPPEQAAGGQVTPAADQYAFAIALREALAGPVGDRPAELPGWIAAIVARGTAADPADRFAAMADLLRALARDPARIWRRRGIAAVALAGVAVAFAVGRVHGDSPTCVGSTTEIARSWSPATRAQMVAHLRGLGAFGAGEADRLGDELDRYGAAWAGEHRRACLAHEHGELPAALHERRSACLARGRAALTAVAELMTTVSADALSPALVAARSLPDPEACVAADASAVAPPSLAAAGQVAAATPAVERARVLAVATLPDAPRVAEASVTTAEATGYAPLIARAALALGYARAALDLGEPAARAPLERALDLALRTGDDVLAVEAYARLLWAVGKYRGDVVGNWSVMDAIAARTGPAGRFARTLLYNNKAVARLADNDRAGARALLQQALTVSPLSPIRDGEIELVTVLQNLALVAEDAAEREARAAQVVRYLDGVLGPNHPRTLAARRIAGMLTRNPVAAAALYKAACDGYRDWHPKLTHSIAECAFERGWLADERGDLAGARAAMQLATTDPNAQRERGKPTIAAAYLNFTGDADPAAASAAIAAMEQLAIDGAAAPEWWNRGEAAQAYLTAAIGWQRADKPSEVERCWTAALALLEGIRQPLFDRTLARVQAALARRWAVARADDARRLASNALAWYRATGGDETTVAELAAIAAPR
ncbi:MAG TPA: protein kinase, partial [Kofleriaceae bacterium]|nr:protein kinase [Kofleriaceae bacterium]